MNRNNQNDSKLIFYYSAMGCGKTRKLQGDYHSRIEDHFEVVVMKPSIDKKGDDNTLARDGNSLKADLLIQENDNIYIMMANYILENIVDVILVDEAQFLKPVQIEQLASIVDEYGIDVICYGLRTDFRGYLFDGTKRLFEMADSLISVDRKCSCGNNKIYNMRLENGNPVFEGDQIAIDGIDATYQSLCRKCYNREKKKILAKKRKKAHE